MIHLFTPRGLPVDVPEYDFEDITPKFNYQENELALQYYIKHGYVVFRRAVDPFTCENLISAWSSEVKPSNSFIYRQATAKAERHIFNSNGWVMNPILNLQSLNPREFPKFRRLGTHRILTNPVLVSALRTILNDDPIIVQSMYFECNSATWEHQDTYYLDSEHLGSMTAAWIALEDIGAKAGRFFVCSGSHHIDLGLHTIEQYC